LEILYKNFAFFVTARNEKLKWANRLHTMPRAFLEGKSGEFVSIECTDMRDREKNFFSAFHIFRVRLGVFLEVLERKFANFAIAAKSDAKGILDESCACAERVDCTGELALLAINTHTHTNSPSCAIYIVCAVLCVYTNKLRIFATGTSQPLRRKELI
jgi:hypothetical protein